MFRKKLVPLLIIPESSRVKVFHNKHGIFISAQADSVDKIRYMGLVNPKDFGVKENE